MKDQGKRANVRASSKKQAASKESKRHWRLEFLFAGRSALAPVERAIKSALGRSFKETGSGLEFMSMTRDVSFEGNALPSQAKELAQRALRAASKAGAQNLSANGGALWPVARLWLDEVFKIKDQAKAIEAIRESAKKTNARGQEVKSEEGCAEVWFAKSSDMERFCSLMEKKARQIGKKKRAAKMMACSDDWEADELISFKKMSLSSRSPKRKNP